MKTRAIIHSLITTILLHTAAVANGQAPAFGVLFVVNSTLDDPDATPGDGVCETSSGNGVCTLRAAIEETNARNNGGDGINVNPSDSGCSGGVCTISLNQALPNITASVSIGGPGAAKLIVTPVKNGRFAIFSVFGSGTVSISGITVANAVTNSRGGSAVGHYNVGTVNVTNCIVSGNIAGFGQGVGFGAPIYNGGGTMNVTSTTVEFNTGSASGGIFNLGSANVTNCTFDSNSSTDRGGGIANVGGVVNVIGSTFYNNAAFSGGGAVSNDSGATMNITNSTLYANIAYGSYNFGRIGAGGGILNSSGTLNLTNSTVTANSAYVAGGGVCNKASANAVVNVRSTIIALNHGGKSSTQESPDVSGSFHSHGFNFIGKKNGSTGFTMGTDKKGTITSPLDPKLDANGLRNNGGPTQTVALLAGSPAIDKGTSIGLSGTLTTDQRGFARTVKNGSIPDATGGDGTDIGAFEFGAH